MAEFPPIIWGTSAHSDGVPCSKILFKGVENEGNTIIIIIIIKNL